MLGGGPGRLGGKSLLAILNGRGLGVKPHLEPSFMTGGGSAKIQDLI